MKLILTLSSVALATSLQAQIAHWDHSGFVTTGVSDHTACITPSNYTYTNVSRSSLTGSDGVSGGANCFGQWDDVFNTDWSEKIEYKFTAGALASGTIDSFTFDIKNYDDNDQQNYYARLLKDGAVVQNYKGAISNTWASKTLNFTGVSVDPNAMYSVQIQGYNPATGGTSTDNNSRFAMDNVSFNGDVTCVPEPTSTALLGLGGLAFILRRRK